MTLLQRGAALDGGRHSSTRPLKNESSALDTTRTESKNLRGKPYQFAGEIPLLKKPRIYKSLIYKEFIYLYPGFFDDGHQKALHYQVQLSLF